MYFYVDKNTNNVYNMIYIIIKPLILKFISFLVLFEYWKILYNKKIKREKEVIKCILLT
jgi:hypothetical protein